MPEPLPLGSFGTRHYSLLLVAVKANAYGHGMELVAGLAAIPGVDDLALTTNGLLLPQAVLDAPRRGCVNIHASVLPRWRGAAPIQRAVLAGDSESGVTIMQMDEGVDTGDILLSLTMPITEDDTSGTLFSKLADLGGQASTSDFTDEVIRRVRGKLEVWDALGQG